MKFNWMPKRQTRWLLCALFLCGGSAIAQTAGQTAAVQPEAKQAATPTRGFFSPQSYRVKSDLDEALLLTPEQKKAMKAAQDEVFVPLALQESQRRREARRSGVKPTDAEQKAARMRFAVQMLGAVRELHKRCNALLSADQKALVEQVDALVKVAADEVGAPYDAKMRTARGEEWNALSRERDEKIKAVAAPRLETILAKK